MLVLVICMILFATLLISFDDDPGVGVRKGGESVTRVRRMDDSGQKATQTAMPNVTVETTSVAAALGKEEQKAIVTTGATSNDAVRNSPVVLTLENILWSRNWYSHAKCPDVPEEYYHLKNVRRWCNIFYTTECEQKIDDMKKWFSSCQGTIWIRSQSHKGHGDLVNFVQHVLPLRNTPFDLITTDGDNSYPSHLSNYGQLLDNPHLQTWYTQNYDGGGGLEHSYRIQPIPIGLDLHTLDGFPPELRSSQKVLEEMLQIRQASIEQGTTIRQPELWIPPMSISSSERGQALSMAGQCLQIVDGNSQGRLPPMELYKTFTQYRFGLSPPGNGVDCHRTWEMLFFGMIPIIHSSPMDVLYHKFDLPVVLVKDWNELCEERFLEKQWDRLKDKIPLPNEKLTTGYYIGR
jgi:hypothetical protein